MADENVPQGDTAADTGSAEATAGTEEKAEVVEQPAAEAADEKSGKEGAAAATDTDGKPEEGEAGEVEKPDGEAAEPAPEDYSKLEYPDGLFADDTGKESFVAFATDSKLTAEQSQAAMQYAKQQQQASVDAAESMKADWTDQSKADAEFGGEKFAENIARATRTMDKLATPEFTELLNVSGLSNHPDMIRFTLKVADIIEDDSLHQGGSPTGSASQEPLTRRMFPSMQMKEKV